MKPSEAVKPISYLKAHAAEVIRSVRESQGAMIITQNGEATAVLQDVRAYEELQESLALLRILAQSKESFRQGKGRLLEQTFRRVRTRVKVEGE